jgi:hypothetical protein
MTNTLPRRRGRPSVVDADESIEVSVTLGRTQHRALSDRAHEAGVTPQTLVRVAIARYLAAVPAPTAPATPAEAPRPAATRTLTVQTRRVGL